MSAACAEAGLPVPADQDDLDDRPVWIGVDDRGVELGVIAIDQGERLLVIEATPTHCRSEPKEHR
jgi:hypothetical protein